MSARNLFRFFAEIAARALPVLAFGLAMPGGFHAGAATYTVADLGTGYNVDGYRRKVIDDSGEVLATTPDPSFRAYLFSAGSWHDLGEINPTGTKSNHRTIGAGLNNLGSAVGQGDVGGDGGQLDGFLSTGASGTISRLNLVDDMHATDDGAAAAINDLGVIVGSITHNATNVRDSFVFRVGSGIVSSVTGSELFAINNFADTLGEAGIIAPQQLLNGNPLPASTAGFIAQSINNAGQILLSVDADNPLSAGWGLIYDYGANKVVAALPNLSAQSVGYTSFRSINDLGEVVGRGADEGAQPKAVYYSKATGLISLDALNLTSGASAVHLTSAEGINNHGQIVCVGTLDADPTPHSFLLTPDTGIVLPLAATYDGLASLSGANVGAAVIGISKASVASVKLTAPGVSYGFKVQLSDTGDFADSMTVKGVSLNVTLHAHAPHQQITGSIDDGTHNYMLTAIRQAKLGIFTGKFTALLQLVTPGPTLPKGIGWGKMSVSKTGSVKIKGQFGDGSAYSVAATAHFDGTWTFYAPLYTKPPQAGQPAQPGGVAGLMTFDRAAAASDCAGTLKWNKPGDFGMTDLMCQAALFKAVKDTQILRFNNTTAGVATFDFAGGEQSIAQHSLSVSDKNAVTVTDPAAPDPAALTVKLSTANGALTGTFIHDQTTMKTPFTGVVQQKLNIGAGVFQGPASAGSVLLTPK